MLHEGRWHLFGTDEDAQATRTFLLSRIVGPVVTVPGATFVPGGAGKGQEALAELDALWQANLAEITVEPGSDAAVRLSKRQAVEPGHDPGGSTVVLHYTDLDILADELAGYGPEVLVRSPAALRAAVLARLMRVRDAHTETSINSATSQGGTE